MLNIDILNFLSTVTVGFTVLLIGLYVYYLVQRLFRVKREMNSYLGWMQDKIKWSMEYKQSSYTLLVSVVVFSCGVMVQDFTDALSDSESNKNFLLRGFEYSNILRKEGVLRLETLLVEEGDYARLNGLGKELLLNNDYLDRIDERLASTWRDWCVQYGSEFCEGKMFLKDSLKKDKELLGIVNGVYYTSKNWCFLEKESVRLELVDIQTRIDMSRSLTVVSAVSMVVIVALYVYYFVWACVGHVWWYSWSKVSLWRIFWKEWYVVWRHFGHTWSTLLVLLLLCVVSRLSYEIAENNYNERAFGYYVSYVKLKVLESKE
jgi:hypothetical protein